MTGQRSSLSLARLLISGFLRVPADTTRWLTRHCCEFHRSVVSFWSSEANSCVLRC
jgi:hypothetical protein